MTGVGGGPGLAQSPPAARDRYAGAVHRLASAQKSGKGAPAYSRFVNRRLGRYLAAAAHLAGLTPNAVTGISAAFSYAAIAALALFGPSWPLAVAVCTGLVLGYALDAADGQLARLRGGGSPSGEWLDHMVDCVKISSLHLAVLLYLQRTDLAAGWSLVPIGFAVVAATSFFAQILNEQLTRAHRVVDPGPAPVGDEQVSTLRALLKVPTDYGILCLLFALLGAPGAFLAGYVLLFAGSAGYLALALVKWFGDVRALDRNAA